MATSFAQLARTANVYAISQPLDCGRDAQAASIVSALTGGPGVGTGVRICQRMQARTDASTQHAQQLADQHTAYQEACSTAKDSHQHR